MEPSQNDGEKLEGEIISTDETNQSNKGKLIFLFVVGFLLGISIKAQAIKSITMGFDDYKARHVSPAFSLPAKNAEEKEIPAGNQPNEDTAPTQDSNSSIEITN